MDMFRYERPRSSAELAERLAAAGQGVKLLAGGTDLLPQLRSRLLKPTLVLDIKGIDELQRLELTDEGLSIGAAVIFNRLLEERETTAPYRALTRAAADLACYQIRNRATVVGNVANASPCADSVPPFCVFGATVELRGPEGSRTLPVEQFIVGNREVQLQPGEFVARIIVPRPAAGAYSGFFKRKRVKGHDLALANAALFADPDGGTLRLAVGSCTPRPALVDLSGMLSSGIEVERAVALAQETINPIDDVRASIEYRREMVGTMVRRLFAELQAQM